MCDDVLLLGVVFIFNQFRVAAVCRRLFALIRAHVDWVLQLGARFWHLFIIDSIFLFVSLGGVPYLLMLLLVKALVLLRWNRLRISCVELLLIDWLKCLSAKTH